ncbi:unnamed protein product [Ceratitis capitata]|uniref:(Mediterranean fruit fly) hypothetical protein n=1 Tax=Ceratitis capitata TaxID=7213 RepID=A0A811UMJ2_CERCA|nr:unnamed protein product [Ceratitis capitata]
MKPLTPASGQEQRNPTNDALDDKKICNQQQNETEEDEYEDEDKVEARSIRGNGDVQYFIRGNNKNHTNAIYYADSSPISERPNGLGLNRRPFGGFCAKVHVIDEDIWREMKKLTARSTAFTGAKSLATSCMLLQPRTHARGNSLSEPDQPVDSLSLRNCERTKREIRKHFSAAAKAKPIYGNTIT